MAFARKGDGYLALMASTGLEQVISGLDAYRELRSYGQDTVWLCILDAPRWMETSHYSRKSAGPLLAN